MTQTKTPPRGGVLDSASYQRSYPRPIRGLHLVFLVTVIFFVILIIRHWAHPAVRQIVVIVK